MQAGEGRERKEHWREEEKKRRDKKQIKPIRKIPDQRCVHSLIRTLFNLADMSPPSTLAFPLSPGLEFDES